MSTHVIALKQKNKKQALGKLSDTYRTPKWLFKWLDEQYDFDFDICASDENHLCEKYYTEHNPYNGKDWSELGSVGFCNPPFSHGQKERVLSEAYRNMLENQVSSVFVIPSDISNKYWFDHVLGKATNIKIIVGRVNFIHPATGEEAPHGLGCSVVEFMTGEEPTFTVNEFVKRDEIKKKHEK